ncbi:adenylyltransferase/cytidyltransferase family protein [Treponema primitia]|uniref:adenylyltransferase/cytidyltransferase family protein n=1 Tax=Treponema primitia TaxID=88058 RepID=UPI0002554ECD|nr:adenylyltransferase/cytidyltransferase family protein [Treponema primitia]
MNTNKAGNVFTAGVFDLFHAGHMESIIKILDSFPDQNLIVGVATDKYTESFKRTPIQSCLDRIKTIETIFKSNKRVTVIEDPLETYVENYKQWFYEKYSITDHCQGTDFDENPKVYEYIKSVNGFHVMGRSSLMSTTELINKLTPSHAIKLGGDTNFNIKLGNIVIKKVVHGDINFIDDAYTQLLERKLFGITSYQRFDNIVLLPYIEGSVTAQITAKEIVDLSEKINRSGLKPTISILNVFKKYDYSPDGGLYKDLLNDIKYVSHGDMAYTNIVKGQNGLVPIDWEFLCYSVRYWDLGCFFASLYIYKHADCIEITEKLSEIPDKRLATLATMLLCDYWIAWSISTNYDFFSKELKELRSYLSNILKGLN